MVMVLSTLYGNEQTAVLISTLFMIYSPSVNMFILIDMTCSEELVMYTSVANTV